MIMLEPWSRILIVIQIYICHVFPINVIFIILKVANMTMQDIDYHVSE